MTESWNYNASTGIYVRPVRTGGRIRTSGSNWEGQLYMPEWWGNYSQHFPVFGKWCKSVNAARRQLARMRKRNPV